MQSGGTCWAAAREAAVPVPVAGEGGGQVSEAVVLSTIILLRIYCSKALAMDLRLFSKSSDVFRILRRIGRTILPGEKAIGPRSSAQASFLWKAERHVWHSCMYLFPIIPKHKRVQSLYSPQ